MVVLGMTAHSFLLSAFTEDLSENTLFNKPRHIAVNLNVGSEQNSRYKNHKIKFFLITQFLSVCVNAVYCIYLLIVVSVH